MRRHRGLSLLVVAGAVSGACSSSSTSPLPAPIPAAVIDEWRFPHDQHADVDCVDCHAVRAVLAGEPAVPGADDHAPCDRDQCHADAFVREPGPLCGTCHDEVDPTNRTPTTLAPYPPAHGSRSLAAEFSHARHVSYAQMEQRVGFHVACADCHPRAEGQANPSRPGHAACMRCHAEEAAPEGTPIMRDCDDCHAKRPRQPSRQRRLITGDLRFSHATHTTDRKGRVVRCVECHQSISTVRKTDGHPVPSTRACVGCHDDDDRTPSQFRMRACETCHATRSESFQTLAPRSHLPAEERPVDHTIAFRTDHETEARNAPQSCVKCHPTMSGSARDVCDECHQSSRPRDHTVLWPEFEHGPAAAFDADRCATCHTGGFCVACHSRPPRSHFPLAAFARGGHAASAAYDTRACTVCHDVTRDCTGPGCHGRLE